MLITMERTLPKKFDVKLMCWGNQSVDLSPYKFLIILHLKKRKGHLKEFKGDGGCVRIFVGEINWSYKSSVVLMLGK